MMSYMMVWYCCRSMPCDYCDNVLKYKMRYHTTISRAMSNAIYVSNTTIYGDRIRYSYVLIICFGNWLYSTRSALEWMEARADGASTETEDFFGLLCQWTSFNGHHRDNGVRFTSWTMHNTTKHYKLLPNSLSYNQNCRMLPNIT